MENLINFDCDQPKNQIIKPPTSNKMFGLIQNQCFVPEISKMEDGIGETLKPGTMIQIIPDYKMGDECYFMIRDFTNWLDKYKTTVYKCTKKDYIAVKADLWPYLLAIKNEGRIQFVKSVYSGLFDMSTLCIGREILIRGSSSGHSPKYYEFVVRHNGLVKEIGTGYFIGLHLKNYQAQVPAEFKMYEKYYSFGEKGIVVPADWIMLNLYTKEDQREMRSENNSILYQKSTESFSQSPSPVEQAYNKSLETINSDVKVKDFRLSLQPHESNYKTGTTPKKHEQPALGSSETHIFNNRTQVERCDNENNVKHSWLTNSFEPHQTINPENIEKKFENCQMSTSNVKTDEKESTYFNQSNQMSSQSFSQSPPPVERTYNNSLNDFQNLSRPHEESNDINKTGPTPWGPIERCEYENKLKYQWLMNSSEAQKTSPNLKPDEKESSYFNKSNQMSSQSFSQSPPPVERTYNNSLNDFQNLSRPHEESNDINKTGRENSIKYQNLMKSIEAKKTVNTKPVEKETTNNFANEIELVSNADGAVKNIQTTNCDLCDQTVEVRCGYILRECLHSFCAQCIHRYVRNNSSDPQIQCPYNKDYKCEINLLDDEIKDLGGEKIYNKILDNRKNVYVATDSSCRVCPNELCRALWFKSAEDKDVFDVCFQCSASWCNKCNTPHKKGEKHEKPYQNKNVISKLIDRVTNTVDKMDVCIKCRKTNIPAKDRVTLKNCKHTFCNSCITLNIKSQTSGSENAQCIFCSKSLDDDEIEKIAGSYVLQLFIANRKKQSDNNMMATNRNLKSAIDIFKICHCRPATSNCKINLKCKHSLCCTLLSGILQEQIHSRSSRVACPLCFEPIDDNIVINLVDPEKLNTSKRCKTCSKNDFEFFLTKCQHPFCGQCIYDLINNQVFDHNKMTINCSICNELIVDSDILRFGSEELHAMFKSKIEATKMLLKPIDHITLNTYPFKCVVCNNNIAFKCGVVFANCRDHICFDCCKKTIVQQLSNSKSPACPICEKVLQNFEVKAIIRQSPDKTNGNSFECLKCEGKFQECFIYNCTKCSSSICTTCANLTIDVQIANKCFPKCPFCHDYLNEEQVALIRSGTITEQLKSNIPNVLPLSLPDNDKLECMICDQMIESKYFVNLSRCSHSFCRNCIADTTKKQINNKMAPNCPFCKAPIADDQIRSLQPGSFVENQTRSGGIEGKRAFMENNDTSSTNIENIACLRCEGVFEQKNISRQVCQHQFCYPCIKEICIGQSMNNVTPKCPVCAVNLSISDVNSC